jgi:hypothetical protein
MCAAPSSAGWRHSATTWAQWSGTSKPQAGACHLVSPCAHGCTDQACNVKIFPCQLGAVHTWHITSITRSGPPLWLEGKL